LLVVLSSFRHNIFKQLSQGTATRKCRSQKTPWSFPKLTLTTGFGFENML
jgi:hypothetical protein